MKKFVDTSHIKMPDGVPLIQYDKIPDAFEIAISLFETCNMFCSFCFENDKKKKIDVDYIKTIPEKVVVGAVDDLLKSGCSEVNFRMWGGELFFDALPDSMFALYKWFVDEIERLMSKHLPTFKINWYWLSNGVFTKWERVKDILEYSNGMIGFSYDPIDRFKFDWQRQQLWDNYIRFKNLDMFNCISITITTPTILAYIKGDKFFEDLGTSCPIAVNFYTANPGWENQVLNDDVLYEFYKWGLDNGKFNIPVIAAYAKYCIPEYRDEFYRHCDCKFSKQFNNDVYTFNCVKRASALLMEDFYGKYSDVVTEENCCEIKNSLGIQKRGCLSCEHFKHCHMTCFISFLFKGYKISECPISRIYKYINENEHIKDNYKKWRKENENNDLLAI